MVKKRGDLYKYGRFSTYRDGPPGNHCKCRKMTRLNEKRGRPRKNVPRVLSGKGRGRPRKNAQPFQAIPSVTAI